MSINSIKVIIIFTLLAIGTPSSGWSSCDCGSTDESNPCTGQSITVVVKADTPNGGTALDNIYSWSFNSGGSDARCGQFANGDYWIAPAKGQSSITITSISSSSHSGYIAADANPTTESMGFMTGKNNYGNYNPSENIIPNLPQSYSSETSLVAAIQRNESTEGNCGAPAIVGECIDSYNVLTILSSVPSLSGKETIRPNITGNTKEILTFSDLDFSKIPHKKYFTGTSSDGLENIKKRWSHSTEIFGLYNSVGSRAGYCSEGGRAFRSHALLDDYGAGTANMWYNDLMILFSNDHDINEKKPAIAAMLAYGLDLFHAMYDAPPGVTRHWGTGATQHPGKFMPSVILAALQKDQKKANMLKTSGQHVHDTVNSGPLELAQVHGTNKPLWGDIPDLEGAYFLGSYWANLLASQCYDGATGTCNTNIGAKTMYDPHGYIDGPPNKPGVGYYLLSLGVQRSMVATMFLMPDVCEIINYDALVKYIDRINTHGVQTEDDLCVTPDSRENLASCDPYRNKGCLYYGKTWGPTNPNDPKSQCITNPTPPYTKVGRFSNMEKTAIKSYYTATQIEKNWATIRGTSGSCHAPYGMKISTQAK